MKNATKHLIKTLTDDQLEQTVWWYKVALKERIDQDLDFPLGEIYLNFLQETILYFNDEITIRKNKMKSKVVSTQ